MEANQLQAEEAALVIVEQEKFEEAREKKVAIAV